MAHVGHRFLSMTSPLGPDALLPIAFSLEEALSQPFVGIIDLVSKHATIDPDKLLHQPVCVSLQLSDAPARKVRGLVRRFAATGALPLRDAFGYRAEIVPRLWFLSQTEDCRIFENKTTKEIVQTILKEHDIPFDFRIRDVPPRPFTMQYDESNLDFVSRLLQEEGWFYFFSDQESLRSGVEVPAGAVIISDRITSLQKSEIATVAVGPEDDEDMLRSWHPARATSFGSIRQDDYDPDQPGSAPTGSTGTTQKSAGAAMRSVYHWPAHALQRDVVERRTRQQMEAAEAAAALSHGAGFNPYFTAGGRFILRDRSTSGTFTLHGVSHHAIDETWINGPNPPSYSNSFTAFPSSAQWRPTQTIKRPRMVGVYTAMVMGPQGQEIYTDALGRVKLNFRWDHRVDATAGGGVWVRVMQAWGGANAGTCFIPRVGTEVAVSFMDGDPDRPVVMGQLRNDDERPPWALPDHKTRTGLRTRSTLQGGPEAFSELWFDDKRDEEQVMLHAQRDLAIEAENDVVHDVGQNRTATVRRGDDKVTVQQGNRTVDVPQGNHTIQSTKGDIVIKTAAGDIAIKTTAGAVSVEAMQSLTLKVGQSSVTLDQSGVTIKGMMVKVEGQVMVNLKAPMLQLDADGMLKAAGGIMMLN